MTCLPCTTTRPTCSCSERRTTTRSPCAPSSPSTRTTRSSRSPTSMAARARTSSPIPLTLRCTSTAGTVRTRWSWWARNSPTSSSSPTRASMAQACSPSTRRSKTSWLMPWKATTSSLSRAHRRMRQSRWSAVLAATPLILPATWIPRRSMWSATICSAIAG